ncbi:major facilitator superfamily domain-containing protein [Favolaschia claudopus]|uniref:Major facilitator superfamily domain-containing protein n=1 Tax=Favolaschia claudopus TaxID=2862362 RepID=A0AAW0DBK0_9AGAR
MSPPKHTDTSTVTSDTQTLELAHRTPLPASTSTLFVAESLDGRFDGGSRRSRSVASHNSAENMENVNESALPPIDRGFQAWTFLAAAFVVEGIAWGFLNAYGVFLDAYLQNPRYASQKNSNSVLPLIGTLSSGILYCSGSVINPIAIRYPQHRRKAMWTGAALCAGTLIGASYATKIIHLLLLQGVLYGVGGALLYLQCLSFMSEWFAVRRGMANGILFAGTSVGGLLLPLILTPMISKYGPSTTLRILGIAVGMLLFLLLPFVKGRLPDARIRVHGPAPRGANRPREWMSHKAFWLFLTVNTLQALGFFIPIVYLPTFANSLHDSSTSNSALTLAMLNAAAVVGRISMGILADKFNPWVLALSTLFSTSIATFILWGVLSRSFAALLAFGIVYGSIAGGWSSLYTGFVRPLAHDDPAMSTTLYGYLLLSRGIGNIVSTPISSRLYAQAHNVTRSHDSTGFDVGQGRFENMIIYVGTCFAGAAGVAALGLALDVRKARGRR